MFQIQLHGKYLHLTSCMCSLLLQIGKMCVLHLYIYGMYPCREKMSQKTAKKLDLDMVQNSFTRSFSILWRNREIFMGNEGDIMILPPCASDQHNGIFFPRVGTIIHAMIIALKSKRFKRQNVLLYFLLKWKTILWSTKLDHTIRCTISECLLICSPISLILVSSPIKLRTLQGIILFHE